MSDACSILGATTTRPAMLKYQRHVLAWPCLGTLRIARHSQTHRPATRHVKIRAARCMTTISTFTQRTVFRNSKTNLATDFTEAPRLKRNLHLRLHPCPSVKSVAKSSDVSAVVQPSTPRTRIPPFRSSRESSSPKTPANPRAHPCTKHSRPPAYSSWHPCGSSNAESPIPL